MTDEIEQATQDLWRWAASRNFEGHDPHDLLNAPSMRSLPSTLRLVVLQLGRRSPVDLRGLLGVPRTANAKGLALFLRGLTATRDRITPDWKEQAVKLAQRILELQDHSGGWGYPFPWQSRTHYVPKGKPNIVTTAFCAMALLDWIEVLRRDTPIESTQALLAAATPAIERAIGYINNLPRYEGVAFGYAEVDPQVVFNASLLGAELLARASVALGRPEHLALATATAKFVAQHQRSDGSWIYGMESSQTWIDSFHTGFVIDSMFRIATLANDRELEASAKRGLEYYLKTFIAPDGRIRYFPNTDFPVDAHAVGQAISMLSRHDDFAEAERVAHWAMQHLRSPEGYFYYQKHRHYTNRIAYMRWSNAWMFAGLADLLTHK